MIYLLFSIAAIMAIVTAFILNSMSTTTPHQKFRRTAVIVLSIIIFIIVAITLLSQNSYS